jgi:hypothetical protein
MGIDILVQEPLGSMDALRISTIACKSTSNAENVPYIRPEDKAEDYPSILWHKNEVSS